MQIGTTARVLAVATGAVTAAAILPASATAQAGAAMRSTPVVTVHMSATRIGLSVGHEMHAGTVTFRVVTGDRGHELQIVRLHRGYTLQQAMADVQKSFRGDVPAIVRVDHGISFRGGAPARPGRPGEVTVTLSAGRYYFIDQNGRGLSWVDVVGRTHTRPSPADATITAHTYGFDVSALPTSGLLRVRNISDQPHFVNLQRVRTGTTPAMVARALRHQSPGPKPSWLLHAGTDSAVVSPYRHAVLAYDLPAGEYLLACFWPDDETGMPHAYMGMWKLVTVG